MMIVVLLIGSRSIAMECSIKGGKTVPMPPKMSVFSFWLACFYRSWGRFNHKSPEVQCALMLTVPAQVIIGHESNHCGRRKAPLPFPAHSRHGVSYHRKSAHFSHNGRDGRMEFFMSCFLCGFYGIHGHRAALKSSTVSWTILCGFAVFGQRVGISSIRVP